MSWAEVKANQVIKIHHHTKALTVNGIQHSANVLANWSNDELSKLVFILIKRNMNKVISVSIKMEQ